MNQTDIVRTNNHLAGWLEETSKFIKQHVVLTEEQSVAVTGWIAHCYFHQIARYSPLLLQSVASLNIAPGSRRAWCPAAKSTSRFRACEDREQPTAVTAPAGCRICASTGRNADADFALDGEVTVHQLKESACGDRHEWSLKRHLPLAFLLFPRDAVAGREISRAYNKHTVRFEYAPRLREYSRRSRMCSRDCRNTTTSAWWSGRGTCGPGIVENSSDR